MDTIIEKYDSRDDTMAHIRRVNELLGAQVLNISVRGGLHDASKLGIYEKPIFDEVTPKLKALTYGSNEYKASLAEIKPALDHHYEHNSHHPEHHANGIGEMSLFDLLEMLADWKAAGERHADGSYLRSFQINRKRYSISDDLFIALVKTAKELQWLTLDEAQSLFKIIEDENTERSAQYAAATS